MNHVQRAIYLTLLSTCLLTGCLGGGGRPSERDVLVLGGNGQLGADIVKLLVAQGDHVTVLVRAGSDRRRLSGLPVTYVTGDVLSASDMARVFKEVRPGVLINALRVEDNDLHFYEKSLGLVLPLAKSRHISQIIHQSAVGAGANAANFASLGWEKVPNLLPRLRDQGAGESLIVASGIPYTIIRNARIYPEGTPATGIAELTTDQTVLLPMTRADLARVTVSCVRNAKCLNQTYHVRDTSLRWPPPTATAQ